MGDFFQFQPIRGPALWKEPRKAKDEDENGRLLWHQFKQVIILDEQMRQLEDTLFRDFFTHRGNLLVYILLAIDKDNGAQVVLSVIKFKPATESFDAHFDAL
jgi:hypothetical protein